ncbi:MAG: winged helix-turn-helix domain-containing protein [Verrucomicrobiales bacterium]|nr:winged helix-turn-helix domain-containing protein [Verrucomicrobiales bacterium]
MTEQLTDSPGRTRLRFGVFEIDVNSGDLWKHGVHIKLHDKPFQVLQALLEHPGEIVTRKDLQERLWPGDTFVEFENGLNNAISRLRETLGDSADSPRFIETIPRRGYRFIAPVEPAGLPAPAAREPAPPTTAPALRSRKPWLIAAGVVLIATLLAVIAYRQLMPDIPAVNSVAVLPLVAMNVTEGSDDEYLAFGMTEALTAELSKIGALKVISQTSAMQYKSAQKSLPEIARELGVGAVVEGSVVREGNQIRVTVQLIEAASDTHLWAETYRRELRDILAMQTDIARAIAREVHVTLTPREQATLDSKRAVDPAAHEAYLRGRYFLHKQTDESVGKALSYFEQAIALDPLYAPAYAELSAVYWEFAAGRAPTPEARAKALADARAAALRALALDSTLADAHVAQGFILLHSDWDLEAAEAAFRRAIGLSPSNETAHGGLGECLLARGQPQEALKQAQHAYELSPMTLISNRALGNFFLYAGDYDRAIAQLQKSLEMERNDLLARVTLGLAYLQKGLQKEALDEFQKVVRAAPGDWALAHLAYAHAVTGDRAEALRILRPVEARGQAPALEVAIANVGLGNHDKAFAWLQKGCEQRQIGLVMIQIIPQLAPLRSDPRFARLLQQMGLQS